MFAHLQGPVPEYLQKLLSIEKKRDLKKYAKEITITQHDFVTLIQNSESIGYIHLLQNFEFQPEHLKIQPGESQKAFSGSSAGKSLSEEGQKFITKISQIFKQRRILTSHIFYNSQKWHLFYFDQRDYNDIDENHWEHGSHIHFVNYLWPSYNPADLWSLFQTAEATVGGKLHIRFLRNKRQENI